MTTKDLVKRLRWVMLAVILFDQLSTLCGQPGSYWHLPATADEASPFLRSMAAKGPLSLVGFFLAYDAVCFFLVSFFSNRLGLIAVFTLILGHFQGGSSWWFYHWGYGSTGALSWALVFGVAIVLLVVPRRSSQASTRRAEELDTSL